MIKYVNRRLRSNNYFKLSYMYDILSCVYEKLCCIYEIISCFNDVLSRFMYGWFVVISIEVVNW